MLSWYVVERPVHYGVFTPCRGINLRPETVQNARLRK
jgi:hypothetical protein